MIISLAVKKINEKQNKIKEKIPSWVYVIVIFQQLIFCWFRKYLTTLHHVRLPVCRLFSVFFYCYPDSIVYFKK